MPTYTEPELEAIAAYEAYVAHRERILAGEAPWRSLGDFFTDDAVFIDPAWGRVEGIDAIRRFLDESMEGLAAWEYPEQWVTADGDRVVAMFDQVIRAADGAEYRQAGISVLYYAGDGRFSYEMDLMNMAHVHQDLEAARWTPEGAFNMPPRHPVRDYSR